MHANKCLAIDNIMLTILQATFISIISYTSMAS